jgi:hypothetical protein
MQSGHPSLAVGDGPQPELISNAADFVLHLDRLRRRASAGSSRPRLGLDAVARTSGIPRSSVHGYLAGITLPSADRLDALVIALGCDPVEVREWAQARERIADLAISLRQGVEDDISRLPTSHSRVRWERARALAGCAGIASGRHRTLSADGPTVISAYVCTTLIGTYVYDEPRADSARTGYLYPGNNWFICQVRSRPNPPLGGAPASNVWLYTQADVQHDQAGGWGWAPAASIAGALPNQPIPGVRWTGLDAGGN